MRGLLFWPLQLTVTGLSDVVVVGDRHSVATYAESKPNLKIVVVRRRCRTNFLELSSPSYVKFGMTDQSLAFTKCFRCPKRLGFQTFRTLTFSFVP